MKISKICQKWLQDLWSKKSINITVTKMPNDLWWTDLSDRDTCLMLFYKSVKHEVNATCEGIIIIAKAKTRKSQTHIKYIHIGSNIDGCKYSFYPRTIPEWNRVPSTTINASSVETAMPLLRAWMQFLHQHLYSRPIMYVIQMFCWLTTQIQVQIWGTSFTGANMFWDCRGHVTLLYIHNNS